MTSALEISLTRARRSMTIYVSQVSLHKWMSMPRGTSNEPYTTPPVMRSSFICMADGCPNT